MAVTKLKAVKEEEMTAYDAGHATTARITVIVDGLTPLLTHNPESMGREKGPKRGSKIPSPEVEAENACYRFPDGRLGIKGEAFRASLLGAASAYKLKGKATMSGALAHVTVTEELIALLHKDGTPIKDYVIDRRPVVVQKNRVIRARPKFMEWSCRLTFEIVQELLPGITPELICDILQDAGGRKGVGDYRPDKRGTFGRYCVRSYKVDGWDFSK